jgi:hypothetical protein
VVSESMTDDSKMKLELTNVLQDFGNIISFKLRENRFTLLTLFTLLSLIVDSTHLVYYS